MSRQLIHYNNNTLVIRTDVRLSYYFNKNDRRFQTETKTSIHRKSLLKQNIRYAQNKLDNQNQSDNHLNK